MICLPFVYFGFTAGPRRKIVHTLNKSHQNFFASGRTLFLPFLRTYHDRNAAETGIARHGVIY
jgi:hypothetical protein